MIRLGLLVAMILGSMMSMDAQKYHYLLDDFKAFRDRDKVVVTWVMGAGNSCIGVGIYRATDNENFDLIGEFKGICGNNTEATNYSFVDGHPVLNATNYYRLQLGFSGRTDRSVSVEFKDLSRTGYQAIPNPYKDYTKIYFDNSTYDKHFLTLYNSVGQQIVSAETTDEYFILDLSTHDYPLKPEITSSEVEYFVITNASGQKVTSGTIVRTNN